jgi:hypothetical protein
MKAKNTNGTHHQLQIELPELHYCELQNIELWKARTAVLVQVSSDSHLQISRLRVRSGYVAWFFSS